MFDSGNIILGDLSANALNESKAYNLIVAEQCKLEQQLVDVLLLSSPPQQQQTTSTLGSLELPFCTRICLVHDFLTENESKREISSIFP